MTSKTVWLTPGDLDRSDWCHVRQCARRIDSSLVGGKVAFADPEVVPAKQRRANVESDFDLPYPEALQRNFERRAR